MAKTRKTARQIGPGSRRKIGRDAESGRFMEAARAMKAEYTANPTKARAKLVELGIYDKSGKLNKNYR